MTAIGRGCPTTWTAALQRRPFATSGECCLNRAGLVADRSRRLRKRSRARRVRIYRLTPRGTYRTCRFSSRHTSVASIPLVPAGAIMRPSNVQSLESSSTCPALKQFGRAYGQRRYRLAATLIEPSPPCVESVLGFLFGAGLQVCFGEHTLLAPPRVSLVGANLRLGTYLRFEGEVDMFAVFFQPAGVSDLFGVPITRVVNTYVDATIVLPGVASLWERLAGTHAFAERVRLTETYLLALATAATPRREVRVANLILRQRGMVRVRDLAAIYGLSERQFERRFAAAVSATP